MVAEVDEHGDLELASDTRPDLKEVIQSARAMVEEQFQI